MLSKIFGAAALLLCTSVPVSWSFSLHSISASTSMLSEHRYQARRAILRGGASESSTPAEIYVCSNHWCASRGAEAALASFVGLIPEEDPTEDVSRTVLVRLNQVGCMGACERGPNIRVRTSPGAGQGGEAKIYEINAVSNLAKVTSVLRDLLNLPVSDVAVATLEANLAGNQCLQRNEITLAIEAYDRALSFGYQPQRGVLLSMRAEAYLLRAFTHRKILEKMGQFPAQLDFGPLLEDDDANVVAGGTGAFGFRGTNGGGSGEVTDSRSSGRVVDGAPATKETSSRGWRARLFATIGPFLSLSWLSKHSVTHQPSETTTEVADEVMRTPEPNATSTATAEGTDDLVLAAIDPNNASTSALPFSYLKAQSSPLRVRERLFGWMLPPGDEGASPRQASAPAGSSMEQDIAATVAAARSAAMASLSNAGSKSAKSAVGNGTSADATTVDSTANEASATAREEELRSAKDATQMTVFHTRLYRRALLKSLDDSLAAADLLPHLWTNPNRAAETLTALGRPRAAAACFKAAERAALASGRSDVASQFATKAAAAAAQRGGSAEEQQDEEKKKSGKKYDSDKKVERQ